MGKPFGLKKGGKATPNMERRMVCEAAADAALRDHGQRLFIHIPLLSHELGFASTTYTSEGRNMVKSPNPVNIPEQAGATHEMLLLYPLHLSQKSPMLKTTVPDTATGKPFRLRDSIVCCEPFRHPQLCIAAMLIYPGIVR